MKAGDLIFITSIPHYFKDSPINFVGMVGKILFFDNKCKDLAKIELNNKCEYIYLFKKNFIVVGEC